MLPEESDRKVEVFYDAEAVAVAAATRFVELAREALRTRGAFSVALAGGSTPQRVYELLASDDFRDAISWEGVHIFFGDERCVPPDHTSSNYRMANEAMLSRLPLLPQNVHRIRGEGDAAANADLYEDEMREFFVGAEWPALDLVLLGMGDDGHTASLFPGTEALRERRAWVVADHVDKLGAWRITLTAPAVNHAAHVSFIVTGGGKAVRLSEVLRGAYEPERLPAQLIRPTGGTLEWLVDRAAASRL